MKALFQDFAAYNRWANQRLYAAAGQLSDADYRTDRRAFFGSVHRTLNHILVSDRLWLQRLTGTGSAPDTLDAVLFDTLAELTKAREAEDARIGVYVGMLDAVTLSTPLAYANLAGARDERPIWQLLSHLFNHQTHHRAQAQTLIHQAGFDVPPLDFIYFQRERG